MFASDYSGHCAHAASRRWSETIVLDLYEDLIALVEVRERSLGAALDSFILQIILQDSAARERRLPCCSAVT